MRDDDICIRTTLPSGVTADRGAGGLDRLTIHTPTADAELYLQGAHLTSWHPAGVRAPVLWMSACSQFAAGKPIRGGVPICFPWFGAHHTDSAAPAHGFARLLPWTLTGATEGADGKVTLSLELAGREVSPAWRHALVARYRITVGAVLELALEVENAGDVAFTFEEALHTYFAVGDVQRVTVAGLEGHEYLDKVAALARRTQGNEPVHFTAETDRVYLDTRATVTVRDDAWGREVIVRKSGSDATVVWNPWIAKARAMPDFGDDEWPSMVCVETCNVGPHAIALPPGAVHALSAAIEARDR
jgi:glucose-6-phosphate 1-epimerase